MHARSGFNVALCSEADKTDWDNFLKEKQGTFYQLYGWKTIMEQEFGHRTFYLVAKESANIVGIIPQTYLVPIPGRRCNLNAHDEVLLLT